jgi:hypothetical protein
LSQISENLTCKMERVLHEVKTVKASIKLIINVLTSFIASRISAYAPSHITYVTLSLNANEINHSNLNNFKMKTKFFTRVGSLAILLFFLAIAQGAIALPVTFNVTSSTSWSALTGGNGPGGVPGATDIINITTPSSGAIVFTVDFGTGNTGSAPSCAAITLDGANSASKTATITFTGTGTLTLTGALTLSATATGPGILTMTSGTTLKVGSFVTGTGGAPTYTVNTGTVQTTGSFTMPAAATSFASLSILSGTCTLGANITATSLSISNGATLAGSTFTIGVSGNLVENGTLSGTAVITLSGANATIDGSGTISNTSTVSITANHTINATANLTIASIIAIGNGITVTNNGIVNSTNTSGITGGNASSTWNNAASTSSISVLGAFMVTGVVTATFAGNTVTYTANFNNYVVKATTYSNLTINTPGFTSTGLAGATSVTGTLTLTGGTFATGTNLSMGTGAAIAEAGGALTGTISGTYSLTYSGASRTGSNATYGANVSSVTINMTAGNTITLGVGFTCTGNLTITQGTLDASTFTLNIAGNFVNNGTFTASSTSIVNLNGSSAQSISGSTATTTFSNLTLNNAAGLTLNNNVTVSTTLTLTSGKITLGTNNLVVGSISNASSARYIVCNGATTSGTLTINSIGATPTLFPIGTSTYTPFTIDNSLGTTQGFSALVFDGVLASGTTGGANGHVAYAVNKTWVITNLGASPNATLTMQWNSGDQNGSFTPSDCYISHYSGSSWDVPAGSAAAGSGPFTLSRSGITSFSPFAIGSGIAPLPVKLISFTAALNNKVVEINWSTASEINNNYFTIERSDDGKNFLPLTTVRGAGNSQAMLNYNAMDAQPLPGTSYYRLKQTDFNGATETFGMVSITNNVSQLDFSIVSANPTMFTDRFSLNYKMPANGNVRVVITGMSGNVVSDVTRPSTAGMNTYEVNNTMMWRSGIYTVQIYYNNWAAFTKINKR